MRRLISCLSAAVLVFSSTVSVWAQSGGTATPQPAPEKVEGSLPQNPLTFSNEAIEDAELRTPQERKAEEASGEPAVPVWWDNLDKIAQQRRKPGRWPEGYMLLKDCSVNEVDRLVSYEWGLAVAGKSPMNYGIMATMLRDPVLGRAVRRGAGELTEEFIEEVTRRAATGAGATGLLTALEILLVAGAGLVLSGALVPGFGPAGMGPAFRYRCLLRWQELNALDYDAPLPPSPQEVTRTAIQTALSLNILLEHKELQRRYYPRAFDDKGRFSPRNGCKVQPQPITNFRPLPAGMAGPPAPIPNWLLFQVAVTGQHNEYRIFARDGDNKLFDGVRYMLEPEPVILMGIEVKGNIVPTGQQLTRWVTQAHDQRDIANKCKFILVWVVGTQGACDYIAQNPGLIPAHIVLYTPHTANRNAPILERLMMSNTRRCN
jgi:hypothetical protein